jgi:endonuclease/exonuclease/phosphatase family metal-dependent hydrolase
VTTVRVLTYNIHLGGRNRPGLREVVRAARPDVLVVNESPKAPLLWRPRCRRLAREWGMRYVDGGRPAGSNMILAAPHVVVGATRCQVLPQPPGRPRRGVVAAQLSVQGHPLGVVGCHLGLDAAGRAVEVQSVIDAAQGLLGPVVVAGDLNEPPRGPSWARLAAAGFRDLGSDSWRTFPADRPTKRIDALLLRGDVAVERHGDPGVPAEALARASDHRPVCADVLLNGGGRTSQSGK